ncbi:MAG TPA: aminotransferase class I/II-fold pyridoxal phosphate-dependent enzyme, partial [Pseudobdellovibrionaceae bacterium]|nr:aminotransferase class I/II-fold pyridoxal phosphate-dependent enzyme [Pseudobdellovibrionaceae bacterium]
QVKQLLRTAQESRSMVLIDEAYHLFYPHTVIQLTKEFSNLLVSRTFSKAWGVAGLRVGYLVANPELMQLIHKNRPMYEVSTLSSELLYLWLDHKSEVLKSVGRLLLGKQQFVEAMTGMGFSCPVSHGNFVHVKFDSFEKRAAELLRDVVLYRSSYPSGNCLHGYSRFSLGTPEQMETIANRLKWGAV